MASDNANKGLFWAQTKAKGSSSSKEHNWIFAIVASPYTINSIRSRLPKVFHGNYNVEDIVEGLFDRTHGVDYAVFRIVSPINKIDLKKVYRGNIIHHRGLPEIVSRHLKGEDIRKYLCMPSA